MTTFKQFSNVLHEIITIATFCATISDSLLSWDVEEGLEEKVLKGPDKFYRDKDWDETEELCGSDSLFCMKKSETVDISDNKGS